MKKFITMVKQLFCKHNWKHHEYMAYTYKVCICHKCGLIKNENVATGEKIYGHIGNDFYEALRELEQ